MMWPPKSLVTGETVAGPGLVAPADWAKLSFITGSVCRTCGTLLQVVLAADTDCPACLARPPVFDHARAALIYDDLSRSIILGLKHGGRREGLSLMARWMASAMGPLMDEVDVILPVPLHYRRLVSRGFNQSQWLAAAIARETGKPCHPHALKRFKSTPSQAGQSAKGRRRNVRGAFGMGLLGRNAVRDRTVLLVDDVFTTGATVEACARVLKAAGANKVCVSTLMRVARPVDPTI